MLSGQVVRFLRLVEGPTYIAKRLRRYNLDMPQRMLNPDQRLREHLEDALAEADALGQTVVAALISEALDALAYVRP